MEDLKRTLDLNDPWDARHYLEMGLNAGLVDLGDETVQSLDAEMALDLAMALFLQCDHFFALRSVQ